MPFIVENKNKKRIRRRAKEIAMIYKCPISDCGRSYGLDSSLNQHLRYKHKEYYNKMIK